MGHGLVVLRGKGKLFHESLWRNDPNKCSWDGEMGVASIILWPAISLYCSIRVILVVFMALRN